MRGSVLRVSLNVIGAAIGFFMMPFLISHLGAYWYGIFITTGSIVGHYYLLDFGLSQAVTRFVTEALTQEDTEKANAIVSTAFGIYVILSGLVLILTVIIAASTPAFLDPGSDSGIVRHLLLVYGVTLAIGFPFKALAGIVQARLRYDLLSLLQFGVLVVTTVLTVYLIGRGHGVVVMAYIGLLGSVMSDIMFLWLCKRLFPEMRLGRNQFEKKLVHQLFSFSFWAFITNIASQIRLRYDSLVIASLQSAAAVTHYSVGARAAEIANEFLYQATNLVQPLLTQLHARNERVRLQNTLLFLTKINIVLGLFVTGMLLIMGKAFITRWMGPSFESSATVLYVIAIALTVGFVVNPLDNALYAVAKHRFLGIVNVLDAVANLGLSIVLGYKMGVIGVALGTLIPMVLTRALLVAPYTCQQTGLRFSTYVFTTAKAIGAALLVLIPVGYMLQPHLVGAGYFNFTVIVLLTGTLYAPISFFFIFNSQDRALLYSLLRK